MMKTEWRGFKGNMWQSEVNLRDFIHMDAAVNITPSV